MSKLKASRPQENTKLLRALLIVAILTTLAISPNAINAFNSIKLIVNKFFRDLSQNINDW